jgi:hypothetical protein
MCRLCRVPLRAGRCTLRTGQQPSPHVPHRDQIQALRRHTPPGQPMAIEQHLIIEGHMTPSAIRPLHAPPGCGTPRAGRHRRGGIVPRHRGAEGFGPRSGGSMRLRRSHPCRVTHVAVRPSRFKADNTPLTSRNRLWRRIPVQNPLYPASTRPVSRPGRQPATGPPDSYVGARQYCSSRCTEPLASPKTRTHRGLPERTAISPSGCRCCHRRRSSHSLLHRDLLGLTDSRQFGAADITPASRTRRLIHGRLVDSRRRGE